jgi:DNA-binding NarL/FixJ family response regulator
MQTIKTFKIILADDHTLLRDALANLIENFEQFTVVAKAVDGLEVVQVIENGCKPDIVIIDLNMPNMDGYETAKWITKHRPEIKIIVLTMYDSEIALIRLLQSGVNGYLKKDIHPAELEQALLTVGAGEYYYTNHSTHKIASLFKKSTNNHMTLEKSLLTDTEIEFLKLASSELTYKEIAHVMHLTPRHIDSFRDSLFTRLDVKSRVGLAIYAVKNGIVTF